MGKIDGETHTEPPILAPPAPPVIPADPANVAIEMCLNTDRTHARAATAMRNAEGFVQVEVAHITPQIARPADNPTIALMIGPVDIDLPAVVMRDLAHINHGLFKNPMRRLG